MVMLPDSWRQRHLDFYTQAGSGWNHSHLIEIAAVALHEDDAGALASLRQRLMAIGPGYHETLTGFWLELIRLGRKAGWEGEEMARRLSFSQLPLAFYSPALLDSPEAAGCHLQPDLKPLALPLELPVDLAETLVAFQSKKLPKESWTHRCHLRVAAAIYLLLGEPGRHAMAVGIQRLNEAHGVPLTPTGGYHETMTRLWFQLVARAVASTGLDQQPQSCERMERMLETLDDKRLPLRFYSRERILSWEARIGWLEPDLQPLHAVDFV